MYSGDELMDLFIPGKASHQVSSKYFIDEATKIGSIKKVLDLGCGNGDSVDYFRKTDPLIEWTGLDIEHSPEVKSRKRKDAVFVTYDGRSIPFADESFDLVYCNQVLEHVEKPEELISESARVLRKGGFLVGSTSHLEPFHSLSMYNFTPYGFSRMVKPPLRIKEIRPGIDVFTLILARAMNRIPLFSRMISVFFENESPYNFAITLLCRIAGRRDKDINLLKLLFCGHFRFLIQKDT